MVTKYYSHAFTAKQTPKNHHASVIEECYTISHICALHIDFGTLLLACLGGLKPRNFSVPRSKVRVSTCVDLFQVSVSPSVGIVRRHEAFEGSCQIKSG